MCEAESRSKGPYFSVLALKTRTLATLPNKMIQLINEVSSKKVSSGYPLRRDRLHLKNETSSP